MLACFAFRTTKLTKISPTAMQHADDMTTREKFMSSILIFADISETSLQKIIAISSFNVIATFKTKALDDLINIFRSERSAKPTVADMTAQLV